VSGRHVVQIPGIDPIDMWGSVFGGVLVICVLVLNVWYCLYCVFVLFVLCFVF
jgi:hypothetical protein